jgi:hypothetical protein
LNQFAQPQFACGAEKTSQMEEQMFKRVLITAAIAGLIAVPIEASAARVATAPGQVTCKEAAKLQFPGEKKMRKAFKKECKQQYKASRGTVAAH